MRREMCAVLLPHASMTILAHLNLSILQKLSSSLIFSFLFFLLFSVFSNFFLLFCLFAVMMPERIAVFEDTLYITLFNHSVYRMNKFGLNKGELLTTSLQYSTDLLILHPLRQNTKSEFSKRAHQRVILLSLIGKSLCFLS